MNEELKARRSQLLGSIAPELVLHLTQSFRGQVEAFLRTLGIARVNLVVDTNFVIEELSWLTRKRRNPSVPGRLAELSRTGLVTFFAPLRLAAEVEDHIPELSHKWNVAEEDLWRIWEDLARCIEFREHTGGATILDPERDPKDHDFIHLQHDLVGAPIVTEDKDIEAMGGRTVLSRYPLELNIYLQDKRIEIAFLATGTTVVMLFGLAAWKIVSAGIPAIIAALNNPVVLGTLAGLLIAYMLSPKVREVTDELLAGLYQLIARVAKEAGKIALEMGAEYMNFHELGDERLVKLAIRYPGAPLTEYAEQPKDPDPSDCEHR